MSRSFLRQSVLRACAPLLVAIFTSNLLAQQPKVLAPHRPVLPLAPKPWRLHKPSVPRSMVGGLWKVDATFKSTIYIKNYVQTSELTVTPVLHLSNGKSYTLPEIKLEPAGIALVSVNDALRDKGIAPYATLSGYVEVKYQWPWDALCVTVRNVDIVHSLIYTYFLRDFPQSIFRPQAAAETHYTEGMWWKHDPAVSGFVALTNVTANPILALVEITDSAANVLGEHSITVSPHGTKTLSISELQSRKDFEGGIRVTYPGPEHSILVNGGLEDGAAGYSANLPFYSSPPAERDSRALSFAELGLMTGAADPMMSFPAGTIFTPYSLVHNVSDWTLTVTPSLYWMEGAVSRSFQAKGFTLSPHRTMALNVMSLLNQAGLENFNGSFNLILDVPGDATSLLMASGSVDQSGTYVFEVLPKGVGETSAQGFSYWSIGNGDDTMVTLWNPADEAQDYLLTLFFSGGHYNYPIHLESRATLMFNISEIAHNQNPDAEGNVIPLSVHEGSGEIAGAQGINQHMLLVGAVGTYNVNKATCGSGCWQCTAGATDAFLGISPFGVAVSGQTQLVCTEVLKGGHQLTCSPSWSSSKNSIATVNSTGLVTGVNPGLVSIDGGSVGSEDTGDGTWCTDPPVSCPLQPIIPAPAGGSVKPKITSISPNFGKVGTNVPVTISGTGFGTAPTVNLDGTGITVTYGTKGNTSIVATFNIAASAPIGVQGVTVTNTTTSDAPPSSPVDFQVTPASAVPVNFRQTAVQDAGGGNLKFTYEWDSSTGNLADIATCSVGESVAYPGTGNFNWTSPPYDASGNPTANPTTGSFPGSDGGFYDNQLHPGFLKPYVSNSFTATQTFNYKCGGGTVNLEQNISIYRSVQQNGIVWTYIVTKSGSSASVSLP